MIFTIGKIEIYEPYIQNDPNPEKLGRDDERVESFGHKPNFPGGSVWETQEQAQKHLDENKLAGYRVYGVEADWSADTYNDSLSWNSLKNSARLIKLEGT